VANYHGKNILENYANNTIRAMVSWGIHRDALIV
jgi:hypothetical protein